MTPIHIPAVGTMGVNCCSVTNPIIDAFSNASNKRAWIDEGPVLGMMSGGKAVLDHVTAAFGVLLEVKFGRNDAPAFLFLFLRAPRTRIR